jgi:hypothetical protein
MQPRNPHYAKRFALAAAVIGISAVVLGSPGAARADNLVVNGDLTRYTTGPNGPGQWNGPENLGSTNLTGWSSGVSPGRSQPIPAYNDLYTPGSGDTTGSWYPGNGPLTLWGPGTGVNNGLPATDPAGGNFIAMDGDPNDRTAVTQTVSGLTAGQTDELGFYWAGSRHTTRTGPTTESVQVSLGGETQSTAVVNNASQGFTGWMYETMTFTARSSSEVLSFLAVGTPAGGPTVALLADVSLNAVPKLSFVVLLGVGLLGAVGYRRLRRRAGAAAA